MNKWILEHSCDKKGPVCDELKQKKNDVKNTPPETIRNEKKLRSEKGTKLKKCRLRFYGAIRRAVQRRTPRSARL